MMFNNRNNEDQDLYLSSGNIIDQSSKARISVKNLIYKSSFPNKKALMALVLKTLSHKKFLEDILESIYQKLPKIASNGTFLCILYQIIFGRGRLENPWIKYLGGYIQEIKNLANSYLKTHGISKLSDMLDKSIKINTYARINTLKISLACALEFLQKVNFQQVNFNGNYSEYINFEKSLNKNQFSIDPLLKNVLCFHPNSDLHNLNIVKNGSLIIQDKASCLPTFVLNPPPGSFVLDCCAAPGNKTSQICAILENKGKVIALDKDLKRLELLKTNLNNRACVFETLNTDFLEVNPKEFPFNKVEYILLDPTCSSSGDIRSFNHLVQDSESTINLAKKKAVFQKKALEHALSFPKLKSLVYSTCSIHEEENEQVVLHGLKKWRQKFKLANPLREWPLRGDEKYKKIWKNCIRAHPLKTNSNGFFVSKFIRKSKKIPLLTFSRFYSGKLYPKFYKIYHC